MREQREQKHIEMFKITPGAYPGAPHHAYTHELEVLSVVSSILCVAPERVFPCVHQWGVDLWCGLLEVWI